MSSEYAKPLPRVDFDNAGFFEACREHRLVAQFCLDCGRWRWPPVGVCAACHSWNFAWQELPGTGVVAAFTVPHRAFHPGFELEVPYVVADVVLDGTGGHVLLLSNIVDCRWDEVRVGMPVTVEFEDVTDEFTLPKFRAIEQTESS